ncbi:MAG: endonuclease/exonuclease/phosphatase family protein [Opitutaceae bacterium]|nr:endonuclease/exonuclease/phosphatase family protein [Opitutaceae bacterium]
MSLSPRLRQLSLVIGMSAVSPLLMAADPTPFTVKAMTYNIQVAGTQPPHAWALRLPLMVRLLQRETPDVIGTQEGRYEQVRDLATALPDYDWIGVGRDGGSEGEFMAVFYRRARFEPVAFDHFWLSDTPAVVGSATWGNQYRRMVTWVRFRERATNREFEVWNTHFDHEVEPARVKSAALIRQRLAATDRPLLLLGDFNCVAGRSVAYTELTVGAGLTDAWNVARRRGPEDLNTFNGHKGPQRRGERIDWILGRAVAAVDETAILDYAEAGLAPSDHYPVTAQVTF